MRWFAESDEASSPPPMPELPDHPHREIDLAARSELGFFNRFNLQPGLSPPCAWAPSLLA
ncbi:MAG: hypothetical protein QF781_02515 [Phycisphaerales bacterium]|jgi:hypothetical protein|nr:hypothetical protein [Phycisphaerales bacterium]MDP7087119.1 hypothetical protein [Phycisphaerales bacterium]HCA38104.1 hypothetical protein [Phycisphaerales bacterium]|tara:strand:+ start:1862 stop:2041 length:180 start_codon:yes stop_codon:yes gene_type:complete